MAGSSSLRKPAFSPQDLLEELAIGVLVCDRDGNVLYRNAQAAGLLAEGDTLAEAFKGLRFGGDGHWRLNIASVLSTRSAMEWRGISADNPSRSVEIRCVPSRGAAAPGAVILYLEGGKHIGCAEERYDVGRRMASLGKLAARVAHELNNPLDGILRYINLAIRVAGDVPESRLNSYLTESRSGLLRMIRIIGDLLEFSRNSDAGFEETGINDLIEQAIRACANAADVNRVVVSADFQGGQMPRFRGGRLYQVCCNLMRNAIDAMPDGGRLTISSGLYDEHVVIRIADTGVGLPHPVEKIFEPFYTTKQPGKGTGLGLAICKEFVEDMGGTIIAANQDGGGALFTVRIPVARLQPPQRITPEK